MLAISARLWDKNSTNANNNANDNAIANDNANDKDNDNNNNDNNNNDNNNNNNDNGNDKGGLHAISARFAQKPFLLVLCATTVLTEIDI